MRRCSMKRFRPSTRRTCANDSTTTSAPRSEAWENRGGRHLQIGGSEITGIRTNTCLVQWRRGACGSTLSCGCDSVCLCAGFCYMQPFGLRHCSVLLFVTCAWRQCRAAWKIVQLECFALQSSCGLTLMFALSLCASAVAVSSFWGFLLGRPFSSVPSSRHTPGAQQ